MVSLPVNQQIGRRCHMSWARSSGACMSGGDKYCTMSGSKTGGGTKYAKQIACGSISNKNLAPTKDLDYYYFIGAKGASEQCNPGYVVTSFCNGGSDPNCYLPKDAQMPNSTNDNKGRTLCTKSTEPLCPKIYIDGMPGFKYTTSYWMKCTQCDDCIVHAPTPSNKCKDTHCVNGICDPSNGKWLCNEGWTGPDCKTKIPDSNKCLNKDYGNGKCNVDTEKCDCNDGWTGSDYKSKIDEKSNIGIIIGIIVGLIIFISVIVLIWWYFQKIDLHNFKLNI